MIRNWRCCGLERTNKAWHPSGCLGHMLLGKHSNMKSLEAAEDQYVHSIHAHCRLWGNLSVQFLTHT